MRKPISKSIREAVWRKYGGRCAYCGVVLPLNKCQPDHIRPYCMTGGHDGFDNLNPSCKECNNYKFAWTVEEFRIALKNLLNEKPEYLFKSKTKMQVAINMGAIVVEPWDGEFWFEKYKEDNDTL